MCHYSRINSIHSRFADVLVQTLACFLYLLGLRGRSYADVPPGLIALCHGLRQNLCINNARAGLLLGILNSLAEFFRCLSIECLHAVAFANLTEIGVAVLAVQLAGLLVAVTHLSCQRTNAVAHLEVIDAAECRIIEYNNGDLCIF